MNAVPRCVTLLLTASVYLCLKEQKEIQEATLEASMVQHVLMCPACFLGSYLSLSRNHYKQAAMRANAQALQAGAVACGQEHGQHASSSVLFVVPLAGAARAVRVRGYARGRRSRFLQPAVPAVLRLMAGGASPRRVGARPSSAGRGATSGSHERERDEG